jgi:hypothetical protein
MEERKDMSMQNQVVTVVSMMGELCGRIKDETDTTVTLESPRLFVPGQDASGGGFAPGVSMTGAQDLKTATINKSVILTVIPAHESIVKGWVEYTSGIIV